MSSAQKSSTVPIASAVPSSMTVSWTLASKEHPSGAAASTSRIPLQPLVRRLLLQSVGASLLLLPFLLQCPRLLQQKPLLLLTFLILPQSGDAGPLLLRLL